MGFVNSSSTITVQAYLTNAGKKKLYESIETTNDSFITKFSLGDSDANYSSIESGFGNLEPGYVPEATNFKPKLRSYALAGGVYRPGVPELLVNGDYGQTYHDSLSIGANEEVQLVWDISSEWPKNSEYTEEYRGELIPPEGLMSEEAFNRLFFIAWISGQAQLGFKFSGGASAEELEALVGVPGNYNSTTVAIRLVGKTTHAIRVIYVDLTE